MLFRSVLLRAGDTVLRIADGAPTPLPALRRARCLGLADDGAVVAVTDRALVRSAANGASDRVVSRAGPRAMEWCAVLRGGEVVLAGDRGRVWWIDAATGELRAPPVAAGGDLPELREALEGLAPAVRWPSSSWTRASAMDLRARRLVTVPFTAPACAASPDDGPCVPVSHTWIRQVAVAGDGLRFLGTRDVDDTYGRDALFVVNAPGGVRTLAPRTDESLDLCLSPDGALIARLPEAAPPALELLSTTTGDAPRRAPCPHRRLAFAPDGRALVTWDDRSLWRWTLSPDALTPTPLERTPATP